MNMKKDKILRVYRTKSEAKESYDKISRFYDYFTGIFETKYINMALKQLEIKEAETIFEIGFGTGHPFAYLFDGAIYYLISKHNIYVCLSAFYIIHNQYHSCQVEKKMGSVVLAW
jgi:hypothetical protein